MDNLPITLVEITPDLYEPFRNGTARPPTNTYIRYMRTDGKIVDRQHDGTERIVWPVMDNSPATPETGRYSLFRKDDGKIYRKGANGSERLAVVEDFSRVFDPMPEVKQPNNVTTMSNNVVFTADTNYAVQAFQTPSSTYISADEMVARSEVQPGETLRYSLTKLKESQKRMETISNFTFVFVGIYIILRLVNLIIFRKPKSHDRQNPAA